jgi:hypothetical protein
MNLLNKQNPNYALSEHAQKNRAMWEATSIVFERTGADMTDVQYTKVRVLCEREHVFDIADKLARLFHLRVIVEGSQNSPNPHTQWVMIATSVPYSVARDTSVDDFLARFGITNLSAMPGIVAYNLAPLSDEDMDGSVLQAVHKQPSHITGLRHLVYICVDNYDLNYDTYLDPAQVYQWPEPLRLMSDYILSDEFVSLVLTLHMDIYKVKYEDASIIQPDPKTHTDVNASWANWKDRKSNRPQPKDDLEEQQEWLAPQHIEDVDYFRSSHWPELP